MKESGVLGGSKLGIVLLQALTNASSATGAAAATSVENRRNLVDRERRRAVAWRSILGRKWDSLGSQVGEKKRERSGRKE